MCSCCALCAVIVHFVLRVVGHCPEDCISSGMVYYFAKGPIIRHVTGVNIIYVFSFLKLLLE